MPYAQKALKEYEELGSKSGIAKCLTDIGKINFEQKKYDKAIKYFKRSLILAQEIEYNYRVVNNFLMLADIHLKQKDYKIALHYLQSALISNLSNFSDSAIYHNPLNLNTLSKIQLFQTLKLKAKLFYLLSKKENTIKNIEASISTYKTTFDLINRMRNDFSHESTKLLLSEKTKYRFGVAILAAIKYNMVRPKMADFSLAFEFIEKSKSSTLSAYISDSKMKQNWNIPDSILEKEKNIIINRRFYETSIQKGKAKKAGYDTLLVQDYQDKLFYYSRQYDTLINTLEENYPNYYQLKYEQKVADINDIQNQLGEKGALLNYFVGDTSLFVAAINKDTLVYKIVKIDSSFNQQIIDYHIDIKSGFGEKEIKNSNILYNYLIKPVEDIIAGKNHLVIIPDEHLYYLPFETLCKNTDYLIKDYAINYHYSATLWLNSKKKKKKNVATNENFIGFAPVFDPKINNGYILSSEWLSDITNIDVATRSVSTDLKNFNALPYSEKEIKAILKLFNKNGDKADGYFYREATEENFKQKAEGYKYVHIASHSFANDNYPALSGIAFSQPDTTGFDETQNEDGILYAGESYNLNLSNAELVVLSSCKSGLGKLVKGEGFLSLSRGFLYAGTPNIVFSLWNVKDKATKDLMVEFYKQLLNRKTYAEALRAAKLKLIKNSKTAEPKFLGAWVLVGE